LSHLSNLIFQKESWSTWRPTEKYDLVFLNHVLHEEKLDDAKNLFEKAVACLKDEGKLIVISFMGEQTESLELAAVFRMNLLLEMGSDLPALTWIRDEAKTAGIKEEAVLELPGGRVAWIGAKD
jgi:trans-aconitate methyltransferase